MFKKPEIFSWERIGGIYEECRKKGILGRHATDKLLEAQRDDTCKKTMEMVFRGTCQMHIADREMLSEVSGWAECQDVGVFVYFTKDQWQSIQKLKEE